MTRTFFKLALASQFWACALPPTSNEEIDEQDSQVSDLSDSLGERFQLRVSLYPWIPDPESFLAWIESDFESKNPGIDLVVRALKRSYDWEPEYVGDLAYEPEKTVAALTDPSSADHQHLVEVDTLILGALAQSDAIVPFDVPGAGFLPSARESVRWNGRHVGVPHWVCGNFVISEDASVRSAGNVDELIATLASAGTDRVDLSGDLGGSWGAIATYLDAFRDTYPGGDMRGALLHPEIDPQVAAHLQSLRSSCIKDGINYCGEDAVDLFATGGADALVGYSERLNPILRHPARTVGTLHIASVTLGGGDAPAAFVDALVMSPECTARCRRAAQRFAAYYVSDEVFEIALMALDTTSGVPRYLLPSTMSAFAHGLVGQDRLYRQLEQEIRRARPLPNSGVPEARAAGALRQQVEAALGL